MKFSLGIFTLAAMTSSVVAVNVALFRVTGCTGNNYAVCNNLGSNVCCITLVGSGATVGADSVLYTGLPNPSRCNGWQQTRDGNKCGSLVFTGSTAGGAACMSANRNQFGTFAGASYQAGVRKVRRAESIPEVGRCTETVEADTFVMDNGEEYDLTKMPHALKLQLLNLSGTSNFHTAVMSDTFAAFKKNITAAALPSDIQHL